MAKTTKTELDAMYRVEVLEKCSAGGLALRPGTVAVVSGSVATELADKVKVIDKVEG